MMWSRGRSHAKTRRLRRRKKKNKRGSKMRLRYITYVAIAFLAFAVQTTYAQAPDANPLSTGLKGSYNTIKNNILKAAEKMPEEQYGFKPMPDMQSFGQRLGHIADASIRSCA